VRSGYHFTSEDEELEGKLTSLWQEFQVRLEDAAEHVTVKAPLMMQTLDEKLQVFYISLFTRVYFVHFYDFYHNLLSYVLCCALF